MSILVPFSPSFPVPYPHEKRGLLALLAYMLVTEEPVSTSHTYYCWSCPMSLSCIGKPGRTLVGIAVSSITRASWCLLFMVRKSLADMPYKYEDTVSMYETSMKKQVWRPNHPKLIEMLSLRLFSILVSKADSLGQIFSCFLNKNYSALGSTSPNFGSLFSVYRNPW